MKTCLVVVQGSIGVMKVIIKECVIIISYHLF